MQKDPPTYPAMRTHFGCSPSSSPSSFLTASMCSGVIGERSLHDVLLSRSTNTHRL